jgi:hypothetical protein
VRGADQEVPQDQDGMEVTVMAGVLFASLFVSL